MKISFLFIILSLYLVSSCEEDTPKVIIGVSQCSDDEWRDKMNNELLLEAMFHKGVQVEIRSAMDNNEKQIKDIQYFIDRKVDLLVVSPNESAPVTPIIEKAFDAGIPIIVTDRKILSEKYTAYIGPDNYEIGKMAGEYIAKYLHGKGNIVEIMGTSGSTPAIERHAGFMSVLRKYPELDIVYQEDAVFLKSLGEKKMKEALAKNKDIDLVFAHNDRMASGAYNAAKNVGREKEMSFVGIDAIPGEGYGVDQVLNNRLLVSFINPTGGDKIIQLAMSILANGSFPRETVLPTNIVDKRNAKVLKLQSDYIEDQKNKIDFLNDNIEGYFSRYTNQRIILVGSLILLLLVFFLLFMTLKSNKSIKYLNGKLSKQNQETTAQKEQLEIQRDQLIDLSKQLEEATHSKLMFFTNISHDFLTPLTLVIEPIKQLLSNKNLNKKQLGLLKITENNINILIHLVKQILDFRKHEDGKMELVLSKNNLRLCVQKWNKIFLPSFSKKNIRFNLIVKDPLEDEIIFDQEKIQRVYFNLLSNALKFTNENGQVTVELRVIYKNNIRYAGIIISDTGIGVSVEHIQNIFNRFYKVDTHYAGSGIGLALAKAFMDMHGGEISVESYPTNGTEFTILLPFNQPFHHNIPIYLDPKTIDLENDTGEEAHGISIIDIDKTKEVVLIIEDNPNIREYLSLLLKDDYNVLSASDGKEGLNKAVKYIPDIIICDVMMPIMDGMECCKWLKSEILTCHIPIILLTVCSQDEQRIKGLNCGADSYISKPFNSNVLQTQIRTLIDNRQKLKEHFSDKSMASNGTICDLDKGFIEKLMSLIEQNISNSDFNIEDLGKLIGLSRVQLYRKVKSLTNYSPNEMIRMFRLKKSKSLLASTEMSISEIAYEVGFSSPSYFTKCYKDFFGENPTIFLKRVENGT